MPFNSFDDYPMSWKPKLNKNERTLYKALAEQLEADIENGTLKPGTKLPPQRELADFLDINLSTVAKAFKLCSDKGLLNSSMGSGTFVAYHKLENMVPAEENVIDMGSIMPALARHDEIREILTDLLDEDYFDETMQYLKGNEYWQKEAGARVLREVCCDISPDRIITAFGGQNALAGIFMALFKAGDRLGVDPLVYPGVITLAATMGIRLVPIEQKKGEMSEEGIRKAIKNDGIKGIYIVPNCQNPTNHFMSDECRSMIARVAAEEEVIVIEDGFASLVTDRELLCTSVFNRASDNAIFILSLSKSIGPGLRQAYIAVPERYHTAVSDAIYNMNFDQSCLLNEIAARLILSERYKDLIARRLELLEERNRVADEILHEYELGGGARALSKWLVLPQGMDDDKVEKEAGRRGVLIYGAKHFAVGKEAPVSGLRLAISTPKTTDELRRGLIILRDILENK